MVHGTGGGNAGQGTLPVMILGLGETGYACAGLLRDEGIDFAVADTRDVPPMASKLRQEMPEVQVHAGGLHAGVFASCQEVVVSPGIDPELPLLRQLRQQGVHMLSEIDLFKRYCQVPVAGVTGTNGKSTVVSLLAAMARQAGINSVAGGNLGPPAVSLLRPERQLYLLELSSFQLQWSREALPLAVASVLNVDADHIDRHGNMEDYARIKSRIYQAAKIAVLNIDDELASMVPATADCETWGFSLRQPAITDTQFGIITEAGVAWLARGNEKLLRRDKLPLVGEHNTANYLAALAMGTAIGLPLADMREAMMSFKGLPHRTELVAECKSVRWINDSKATNCSAAAAAVRGLATGNNIVLIAGGQAKDNDFSALAAAARGRVHSVVLLGRQVDALAADLADLATLHRADDMRHAVELAAACAVPGDTVLFSPAAASFDMYGSYSERGDDFIAAVRELTGVTGDV